MPLPRALTGVAASWLVLLLYEWVHFLSHVSYKPRHWPLKQIQRNHRLHHFKNEHFWYNVSTLGVDAILGTDPDPSTVPTSENCLNLESKE
jgi:hypothetical protein